MLPLSDDGNSLSLFLSFLYLGKFPTIFDNIGRNESGNEHHGAYHW